MSKKNRYLLRLLPVLRAIQDNIDQELELQELAKLANMSPFHFHRIFKATVGENLKQHLRRLKLERAAARLRDSEQRILDVALEAGFSSHEAFTRAFSKTFIVSPQDYRNGKATPSLNSATLPQGAPVDPKQQTGEQKMQVSQQQFPEISVIYQHHIGADQSISNAWQGLIQWAREQRLISQNSRCLAIGYDDPSITEPGKQRFDLCITSDQISENAHTLLTNNHLGLSSRKVGGFKVATVIHQGDLANIEQTFMEFYGQWLPQSGFEPADHPPLVEYLNSPHNTPVEELRTALYIPIQ